MTFDYVIARLVKPAEAISVGTGDCRTSLAMTWRGGGVYLRLTLKSDRGEKLTPRPYISGTLLLLLLL